MPLFVLDSQTPKAMRLYLFLGAFLLLSAGCAPDITETEFFREHPEETDPSETFVELGQQTDGALTFRLLAPDSLHIGHSTVWIEASQGETPVSTGRFTLTPTWETGTRVLVSPEASASAAATEVDGRFEGIPFFLQPVGEDGYWMLYVEYEAGGQQGILPFPVDVVPDLWVQHVDEAGDYFVSWVQPVRPSTGNATFELTLNRLTDAGFAPIEGAVLDLYPYMDMGAGEGHSTPYEAPVHIRDGAYRGMVNFIMSGGWDMTVYVQRPGVPADTVVFKGFTVH